MTPHINRGWLGPASQFHVASPIFWFIVGNRGGSERDCIT